MKKNANTIERYRKEINDLEKKLSPIFSKLKQKDNISAYELNIIENKLATIYTAIEYFLEEITNSTDHFNTFNRKKNILFILMILSILTIFIPIVGIGTFMSVIFLGINLLNQLNDEHKYFKGLLDLGKNEINTLTIELDNCLRIVEYIKEKRKGHLKDTLDEKIPNVALSEYELANYIINIWVNESFDVRAYNKLPDDFKNLIINILQTDLNTEETYIINLITMVQRKIEEENISYQEEVNTLTRNRNLKKANLST